MSVSDNVRANFVCVWIYVCVCTPTGVWNISSKLTLGFSALFTLNGEQLVLVVRLGLMDNCLVDCLVILGGSKVIMYVWVAC